MPLAGVSPVEFALAGVATAAALIVAGFALLECATRVWIHVRRSHRGAEQPASTTD